ncbi:hypothetical protein [Actinocrispum wychmicini]|nr:hypothetical protein [Actinocrispum wychmicini]
MTDWGSLSHAYGDASDVPELLARLRSGNADEAGQELWASVLHQGTLYDATPPAIVEICRVLAGRAAARAEVAGWLLAQAVESATACPAEDPLALAVLAAAEPAWTWATKAITRSKQAAVAANVLRAYRHRASEALPLLTAAAARWPNRPEFLVAIHVLDPDSPVLAQRLAADDEQQAAVAAVLLINALGGPPDSPLGEKLISASTRVLANGPVTEHLPDTPVKLIMTGITGVDPQFTEPEFAHPPTAPEPAARLVGALLDSRHQPTATEAYVALNDRNLARSRGVADWATGLIVERMDWPGPAADAMMLAAFGLGPRLAPAVDRIAAVDWPDGSMAGGAAMALLARLDPARVEQVPDWLDRGWGHPDLAAHTQTPLNDRVMTAIAGRLRQLGVPTSGPATSSRPWHVRSLTGTTEALRNNEFIAWQGALARGGRAANQQLAELRSGWPDDTVGLGPTRRADHLLGLGDEDSARAWLIDQVSRPDHRLDMDWLWARPADPAVVEAGVATLSTLDPSAYFPSAAIALAGWLAANSDWDPAALFAARAGEPWPAIEMLGLRRYSDRFTADVESWIAPAVPTVITALDTPGQCLAAAPLLRPDELTDGQAEVRRELLVRCATRLPDRSAEAVAVLAAEPATLNEVAGRLRDWLAGDSLFSSLSIGQSAGFTDQEVRDRLLPLVGS